MARQLILQPARFGHVGEQYQLPRLAAQRAGGQRNPPPVGERYLMAVVAPRGEAACDDVAPQLVLQRLAQELNGNRIGFAHDAMPVEHHHATGKQIEQAAQPLGQPLFFIQLAQTQRAGGVQLTFERGHACGHPLLSGVQLGLQLGQPIER